MSMRLFAKAQWRGDPNQITSLLPLLERGIVDGIDVTTFMEWGGKSLDQEGLMRLIPPDVPVHMEFGDTYDGREVIDFLNPAKKFLLNFVNETLLPLVARNSSVEVVNFHLVGNAQNIQPGTTPPQLFDRKHTHTALHDIFMNFQQWLSDARSMVTVTVEPVHCLSTRRNVDRCIKFAPVGNVFMDLLDIGLQVMFDPAHFLMSLYTYEWMDKRGEHGTLRPVESCLRHSWVDTPTPMGPFPVRFDRWEQNMLTTFTSPKPTVNVNKAMEILKDRGVLHGVHLSNMRSPFYNETQKSHNYDGNYFDYWDNECGVGAGVLDVLSFLRWCQDNEADVVVELKEENYQNLQAPHFREQLHKVCNLFDRGWI